MEMRIIYLEQLPIPKIDNVQRTYIIERVKNILADSYSPIVTKLESEIDELVYKLYGLTSEEIAIVESKRSRKSQK